MDTWRYELELRSEDGARLGEVRVEPDWDPALEWAAFAGVRRGLLPAVCATADGWVEPLWDSERGRPLVRGFRVCIPGLECLPPTELPVSYLAQLAREASAAFVGSGALQAGEPFRYRVHAFAGASAAAAGGAGGLSIEEVATALPCGDRPLARALQASVRWGEAAEDDELTVFVARHVLEEAMARARAHPEVEIGGILVGRLQRDCVRPDIYLEVTAQIPARHALSHVTKLTFTPETWAAAEAAIALRRRGEIMCGWYHDHLDWCRNCPIENRRLCTRSSAFFSADDAHLQRVCFPRAYQVALLISDSINTGMTWSLYGWRRGAVAARGFHIFEQQEESSTCES
jgi:hypothetical protein